MDSGKRPEWKVLLNKKQTKLLLLCALLLTFVGQSAYLISIWSKTADEPIHAAAGYLRLKTGLPNNGFHNPPLLQNLLALPYILFGRNYVPRLEVPRTARYTNLVIGTLLALSIFLASWRNFGLWGALISLACYTLSPTFIAHSSLATLDVGVALFVFLTFFFLIEASKSRSRLYYALCGIFLGSALAAKFTSLVFVGLLPLVLLYLNEGRKGGWRDYLLHLLIIFFFAWLVFAASYNFAHCFEDSAPKDWPHLLRTIVRPFPKDAIISFNKKMEQAKRGGYAFIWGNKQLGGFSYYYPLIFLLKVLPGTLLLTLLLLWSLLTKAKQHDHTLFVYLVVGLLYFLSLSAVNKSQSGIRHLFPFFPFLYFALGALARELQGPRKSFVLCALVLNILCTLWNFPQHLSYYNFLGHTRGIFLCSTRSAKVPPVGGPDLDWGQNDLLLKKAVTGLPKDLPLYVNPRPSNVPRRGYVAISAIARYFVPEKPSKGHYRWLRRYKPIKRVGRTWSIYLLDEEKLKRLDRGSYLEFLWTEGRFKDMVLVADKHGAQKRLLWQKARALLHLGEVAKAASCYRLAQRSGRPKFVHDLLWKALCFKLKEASSSQSRQESLRTSAWALGCCKLIGLNEKAPLMGILEGKLRGRQGSEDDHWHFCFPQAAALLRQEEYGAALALLPPRVDELTQRFGPNLFKVADEWPKLQKMPFCPDKVTILRRLSFYCNSQWATNVLLRLLDEHPDNYQMTLQMIDLWFAQREGTVRVNTGTDSVYDSLDLHTGRQLPFRQKIVTN